MIHAQCFSTDFAIHIKTACEYLGRCHRDEVATHNPDDNLFSPRQCLDLLLLPHHTNAKIFFLGQRRRDEVETNEPACLSTVQQGDHTGSVLNLTTEPEPHCLMTLWQQAAVHQVVP
jgi:hypothetical protein